MDMNSFVTWPHQKWRTLPIEATDNMEVKEGMEATVNMEPKEPTAAMVDTGMLQISQCNVRGHQSEWMQKRTSSMFHQAKKWLVV